MDRHYFNLFQKDATLVFPIFVRDTDLSHDPTSWVSFLMRLKLGTYAVQ
jgi:hypothetical protein